MTSTRSPSASSMRRGRRRCTRAPRSAACAVSHERRREDARTSAMSRIEALALDGLPEFAPGDDLAAPIAAAAQAHGGLAAGDVLVVAHKIVSKAEGALTDLRAVRPTARARSFAAEHGKDPRAVQVVLDESAAILRAERGVL